MDANTVLEMFRQDVDHARRNYKSNLSIAEKSLESAKYALDKHDNVNQLGVLQVTATQLEASAGAFAQAKQAYESICTMVEEEAL